LLLTVAVVTARSRTRAKPALLETYLRTGVRFVFADGAFAGRLLDWARTLLRTTLHIVRKPSTSVFGLIAPPVGRRANSGVAHRAPQVGAGP
jgi:hypothetical protein